MEFGGYWISKSIPYRQHTGGCNLDDNLVKYFIQKYSSCYLHIAFVCFIMLHMHRCLRGIRLY